MDSADILDHSALPERPWYINCGKKGNNSKVCRSSHSTSAAVPTLATISAGSPDGLLKVIMDIKINGVWAKALVDTGSFESFICDKFVNTHKWKIQPMRGEVSMASTSLTSHVLGVTDAHVELTEVSYERIKHSVIQDPFCDVILGVDFLQQHSSLDIPFGGAKPILTVFVLATAAIPPQSLFANLTADCRPIAVKSRCHSHSDQKFINSEVARLLKEGIIEPSESP